MHLGIKNKHVNFVLLSVFYVFAFIDFIACNAAEGIGDEGWKFIYIKHQQYQTRILLKIEIKESVF